MLKKSLLGAAVLVAGFTIRDIRNGEEFDLMLSLMFYAIAVAAGVFFQWTMIPYDWNKNKKKNPS